MGCSQLATRLDLRLVMGSGPRLEFGLGPYAAEAAARVAPREHQVRLSSSFEMISCEMFAHLV